MVGEYICSVTIHLLQEVEVTPRWTLGDQSVGKKPWKWAIVITYRATGN